jgi:transposase
MEVDCVEDIKPLREFVRIYFIKVYYLCGGDRSEISKKLGISVRTVRNYCNMFDLRGCKIEEETIEEPIKNIHSLEETGYRGVTPEERDKWYNKNYF